MALVFSGNEGDEEGHAPASAEDARRIFSTDPLEVLGARNPYEGIEFPEEVVLLAGTMVGLAGLVSHP
uniref:Uncharacterized protein n=1 Tax=Candidatus Kentrum sp. TC TaxID=2126339 RepID=A0A450YXA6_9GAMM|nr:MAG: hypothetical protein BECKTC1821D_GA0114238_102837 [Candidatus Kentron sp. TC]VFK54142.1 MAG: hypothetical protein BECKTC1821F_GA0114240_100433 [Candidatus Kentron sp. TC]